MITDESTLSFAGVNQNAGMFPDPFLDMANLMLPRTLRSVLDMCEGVWLKNGTYRMAASRIVRYFITKVECQGASEDQRAKLTSFLHNRFNVIEQLSLVGDDFLAYGTSASSVLTPFRRYLRCSVCNAEQPIQAARWKFIEWKFSAYCRRCRKNTPHTHVDRKSLEESKVGVKRWAPQDLRLSCHPVTPDYEIYWTIPRDTASEVQRGTPFIIEHMPWEIIEAVKRQMLFKFGPGVVYLMREHTLAGVRTRGWGISRLLSNFAQAWYTQVLKRYNEALAQDWIIPFRVITPESRSKEGDPVLNLNLERFSYQVLSMLRRHRMDPAGWHVLPVPLSYQTLGGEAKNLATPELLSQGMDEMLNAIGIPAELYRGTLQMQAMPVALRLFQQTWPQLVYALNGWLDWAVAIVCNSFNWDKPERVSLQPVTMADDIEQRQMWMQLASSRMISRRTAFAPWGIDDVDEQKRIFEEEKTFAEMQEKFQKEMADRQRNKDQVSGVAAQAGAPQGGVAPMGAPVSAGSAGAMQTPQQMMDQADQLAQQLLNPSMTDASRRRELDNIRSTSEPLWALVKGKLQEYRSQAASVGREAVLSGQLGQQ